MRSVRPLALSVGVALVLVVGALAWWAFAGPAADSAPTTPARPGAPAPAVRLAVLDGGSANLAQERGKVVLINFWATWCEPCKAEMPGLQQLDRELRDSAFVLYPVNMGEDGAAIEPFRQRIGFDLPVLLDEDGSVTRAYGVRALPATFLVDRAGVLREQRLGPLVAGDASTPWSEAWVETRVRQLLEQ
jgi:cytochrome c biogenesis protein CcmG, thiol:disulfide interchange protein DsbE